MTTFDHIRAARGVALAGDPTARHVLLLLATYTDRNGLAWPHLTTLAADAGLSVSTVQRAIGRLRKVGLAVTARPGRGSVYNLAGLADADSPTPVIAVTAVGHLTPVTAVTTTPVIAVTGHPGHGHAQNGPRSTNEVPQKAEPAAARTVAAAQASPAAFRSRIKPKKPAAPAWRGLLPPLPDHLDGLDPPPPADPDTLTRLAPELLDRLLRVDRHTAERPASGPPRRRTAPL